MTFQILCLSGGGYLGLYSAVIVHQLEKEFGGNIARHFDLIAGTSIGGIIALGLANDTAGEDIKVAFEQRGTSIFSGRSTPRSRLARGIDLGRSLFGAKYGDIALKSAVAAIVGRDTKIGDLKHPCIVPAINLSKGGPQIFKTPHHETFRRDLELKVVDVAMATSAAPTYFPLAQVGDALYADGGLYANSPDLLALHEAEYFFRTDVQDIRVLSIGTTTSKFSFAHAGGRNLGTWNWAWDARLIRTVISSQQQAVDYMLRHKLGARYVRLDSETSKEQSDCLSLDTATSDAQQTIGALASATVQTAINDLELRKFFSHIAPAPTFFHGTKL